MAGLNTELFNHFENEFFIPGLEAAEIDLEELHLPPGKVFRSAYSPLTSATPRKRWQ